MTSEQSRDLHSLSLAAWKIEEIAQTLRQRMRRRGVSGAQYRNCRTLANHLSGIARDLVNIERASIVLPLVVWERLARALEDEANVERAVEIRTGIDVPGEPIRPKDDCLRAANGDILCGSASAYLAEKDSGFEGMC